MTENRTPFPLLLDGVLEPRLSRGLWLVKWLLLVPHYVVLAGLWLAFVVLTAVAFVAILVTGRYPRALFDFDVGVLRWSWRVHHYGYGALGTDRYPPFTLADVPDHPAHLDVVYPERLSRGLVLVKWWLLALPHYLVLAVFVGGGLWLGTDVGSDGGWQTNWGSGGLVGLLVVIAGVVLLFRGRYPRPLYDFVLGMDRWAFRVVAYAALMTDAYPPFRLDMGGADPDRAPGPGPRPAVPPRTAWTAGRVVSVVLGAVLLFTATGVLTGGSGLLWADRTQRTDGYLWTPAVEIGTDRHALTSDALRLDAGGERWLLDDVLGDARVEVTPADPDAAIFVGIARTAAVDGYLAGVGRRVLDDLGGRPRGVPMAGGPPEMPPGELDIWVARTGGVGTQVLDWRPADGTWTVVVMRADGAAGLDVEVRAGATVPALAGFAVGLLAVGVLLAVVGALLVALAVGRALRTPPSEAVPADGSPPPPPPPPGRRPEPAGSGGSGAGQR